MNSRRFAHELGIHADTEVLSILFTRFFFQQGTHHIVHRSRQNGASEDYDVVTVCFSQQPADLAHHSFKLGKT